MDSKRQGAGGTLSTAAASNVVAMSCVAVCAVARSTGLLCVNTALVSSTAGLLQALLCCCSNITVLPSVPA